MKQPRAVSASETDGRILRGEATRERVLDAAERCFGDGSFEEVSIRQIAAEAGVTLGVVGFHAGSKLDLFRTVLERRVETLNHARRKRLAALLDASPKPALRELCDAYIAPYLEVAAQGDAQWRAYARLVARISTDDKWYDEVGRLYDPVAREFIAAIRLSRPEAEPERLAAAMTLSVASMLTLVSTRARITGLSGQPDPGSPLAYREMLVDFCSGGIEAMLTTNKASKKPRP